MTCHLNYIATLFGWHFWGLAGGFMYLGAGDDKWVGLQRENIRVAVFKIKTFERDVLKTSVLRVIISKLSLLKVWF